MNYWYGQQFGWISRTLFPVKKTAGLKRSHNCVVPFIVSFSEWLLWNGEYKEISDFLELGMLEGGYLSVIQRRCLCCSRTLYLDSGVCVQACLATSVVSDSLRPHGLQPARLLRPWDSPGKNTGVGCHTLLQGGFLTQGLNLGLPHCRWILYCLSHQGNPWILEWGDMPSSRGSSESRDWTQVSHTAGRFFTLWATREAPVVIQICMWYRDVELHTHIRSVSVPWFWEWHPTPVLLPGKSHGWRSLVGCSPWGCKESDTTEQLHFHFSLSCIGEGNGNPPQRSCLEKPRDGGAWWAAVYGVAQSQTRLKWLSSSRWILREIFL